MMNDILYKVLWVDDDLSIIDSTQQLADDYNIILDHYTNWSEAQDALLANFEDYSAIILDANCKVTGSGLEDETFLISVLSSMTQIFGQKQQVKPWYILSAGTMSNFDFVVKGTKNSREDYAEEWGDMLYMKDAIDNAPNKDKLFENIERVAANQSNNKVLFRHQSVFKYMGEHQLIDSRARQLMLRMLGALYFPEENVKYQYTGNPLRKVLEYLFRSANQKGLLADDCIDKDGHLILLDSSRYMAGLNTAHSNGARWGEAGKGKDGSGGDTIFSKEIADMVQDILEFANVDSHTNPIDETPYFIDENNTEIFFSYLFQLCHVIKWFGQYVEEHSDVDANMRMLRYVEKPSDGLTDELRNKVKEYTGKEVMPECDENGVWHYAECYLTLRYTPTGKIRLRDITANSKSGIKEKYPLFAYYDKI